MIRRTRIGRSPLQNPGQPESTRSKALSRAKIIMKTDERRRRGRASEHRGAVYPIADEAFGQAFGVEGDQRPKIR